MVSLQDATPVTKPGLLTIIGDSGTERYGGFFTEEPNAEWRDESRVDNVETMRRTDGTVKALLNALKSPMLSTKWDVISPDKTPLGEEIRAHCDDAIFNMRGRTWLDFLREAASYLDFGYAAFEIIWGYRNGRLTVVDLQPRIQRSIHNWQISGGKRGITQFIRTDESKKADNVEIPIEKLLVFTNDKEGDDITGQSVLRPAWKHFYAKDKLYRIGLISSERYGVGVPTIYLPESAGDAEKNAAQEMLKNFRANELSRMVFPNGWVFKIESLSGNAQSQIIENQIDHHDRMILRSALMGFIGLTNGDGGSFALSKDQSSFALQKVEDHAMYIAEQITKQVLHKIVYNAFPEHFERLKQERILPSMSFAPLGNTDFKELSEVIKTLNESGAIHMDSQFKQFVHDSFKFPQIPDAIIDEMEKQEKEDLKKAKEARKNPQPEPQMPEPEENPEEEPEEPEDDDNEVEEKKMHALAQKKKLEFWRELTALEDKKSYVFLNQNFNNLEAAFEDALVNVVTNSMDRLKKRFPRLLKSGQLAAIAETSFVNHNELKSALKQSITEAYNIGKQSAADQMGVKRGTTPTQDTQAINFDASELATQFQNEVERTAKETAKQSILNNVAPEAALAAIVIATSDKASQMVTNLTGITIGENINRGRRTVFTQNIADISGYLRSEILDDRTCNMCLSLDQRIVKPDDPMSQLNSVHNNCRGVWIPIMANQVNETIVHQTPKGDRKEIVIQDALSKGVLNVPKSIFNNFKTVGGVPVINSFTQLKKPINNSNADVKKITNNKKG